jgi:hypothetical protein
MFAAWDSPYNRAAPDRLRSFTDGYSTISAKSLLFERTRHVFQCRFHGAGLKENEGDRKSDSLTSRQFRETVGAPAFAAHSTMHEEEVVRIVLVFHCE